MDIGRTPLTELRTLHLLPQQGTSINQARRRGIILCPRCGLQAAHLSTLKKQGKRRDSQCFARSSACTTEASLYNRSRISFVNLRTSLQNLANGQLPCNVKRLLGLIWMVTKNI